jgi:hypothetical protein
VTDRQFKQFIRATKTFAEISTPKNYPGALPQMVYAGSLVLTPPRHPVHLKNFSPGNARGTVKQSYLLVREGRRTGPFRPATI